MQNENGAIELMTDAGINTANSEQPVVVMPYEYSNDGIIEIEQLTDIQTKRVYSFFKRVFDIVLSLLGLAVCALPIAIIAITIKCVSKGSIFYLQERLGLNGKPFKIIKFRTMYPDAEKNGVQWSSENDSRVYPFGKFLRQHHIDELPQLLNCLLGSMSFVGPRPERKCFYVVFEKHIPGFSQRMRVKPGLAGYAVIKGGYTLRPEEKIVYDIEYIKKRSVWLDTKIFIKTALTFFRNGK